MKLKKIIKPIIYVVIFVFVLVIGAFAYVAIFFPNDMVKKQIERQMSEALKREVKINDLNVSIFSGINIKDVDISNHPSFKNGRFLRIKEISIDYDILPLIFKQKFVMNEATLKRARVYAIMYKSANGASYFNFSDLLVSKSIDTSTTTTIATNTKELTKDMIPIEITIGEAGLKDAMVQLIDKTEKNEERITELSKIDAYVYDIDTEKNIIKLKLGFNLSFKAIKNGTPLDKTANIYLGLRGVVHPFDKSKKLNPSATIILEARDGLFYGLYLQKKFSEFLDRVKMDIVNTMKKGYRDIEKKFDSELEKQKAIFLKKAPQMLKGYIEDIRNNIDEIKANLEKYKAKVLDGYANKVKELQGKVQSSTSKLKRVMDTVNKYANIQILKNKINISKYQTEINNGVNYITTQYERFSRMYENNLKKQLNSIINNVANSVNKMINDLKKRFNRELNKYVKKLKGWFRRRLGEIAAKIMSIKVRFPFLEKKLTFDKTSATIYFANNTISIPDLNMGTKLIRIKGKVNYGLSGYINADIDIVADKSLNNNEFSRLFSDNEGNIKLGISIKGSTEKPSFSFKQDIANIAMGYIKERGPILVAEFLKNRLNLDQVANYILKSQKSKKEGEGNAVENQEKSKMDKEGNKAQSNISKKVNELDRYADKIKNKIIKELESIKKKEENKLKKKTSPIINKTKKNIKKKIKKFW